MNNDRSKNKEGWGVNVNVMGLTNTLTGRKQDDQVVRILNKSPSDPTIYTPGLNLIQKDGNNVDKGNSPINVIDQISNFVERIRIETAAGSPGPSVMKSQRHMDGSHDDQQPQPLTSGESKAKSHAEDIILQADQYKAVV